MTTTRGLCRSLAVAPQVSGVECYASATPATPAARRQRRHRARRKQGRFVVPVEVTGEMITALIDQGDVDDANSSDLDCVGKAITAAARPQAELGFSSQNMAQARRRDPLPAAPARSELPDLIRRPASAPAGRGHLP